MQTGVSISKTNSMFAAKNVSQSTPLQVQMIWIIPPLHQVSTPMLDSGVWTFASFHINSTQRSSPKFSSLQHPKTPSRHSPRRLHAILNWWFSPFTYVSIRVWSKQADLHWDLTNIVINRHASSILHTNQPHTATQNPLSCSLTRAQS